MHPDSEISTRDFLEALYPDPLRHERLVVWSKPKAGRWSHSDWLDSLERGSALATTYARSREVYFGVVLQDPARAVAAAAAKRGKAPGDIPLASVRGSESSATVMTAVWVDLDVAGDGHVARDLPPDLETALGLTGAIACPPSIVVASGGGLHVYWLLDQPWRLDSDSERELAASVVGGLQAAIKARAAEHGYRVDSTADLPRVLRLPGTLNHKTDPPRPVRVLALDASRRYCPHDLVPAGDGGDPPENPPGGAPGHAAWARPDRPPATRVRPDRPPAARARPDRPPEKADSGGDSPSGADKPADFDRVMAGCAWLRHCHEDAADLGEPEWFAALSIVGRCTTAEAGGRILAHSMSVAYPRYTPAETDAKLAQALSSAGPRTCVDVAHLRGGFGPYCSQCHHFGHIKSPIVLGRGGPRDRDSRLPVILDTREHEVNDRALVGLTRGEQDLFERGGAMVEVVHSDAGAERRKMLNRPPGASRVQPLNEARLRELLALHCRFLRRSRGPKGVDLLPAHPPQWTARALLARGSWPGLPLFEGLVEGPVLRRDGSVLQEPGFDLRSGLYYAPGSSFEPVPEEPTAAQVHAALARLREVVCDFPFRTEAHFSAWLAALLTPLARFAFEGPSPLNLIDANVRGTGKSLLADVCTTILTGRPAARMSYSRDEDELRKAITSMAVDATQVVLIDNVSGNFGSPTLDRALTAPTWRDRLLGTNVQVEMPLLVTWFATGNNVTLTGDTPRRCLHIRLESPDERPEERSGFRHPRLLTWVRTQRRHLLPDALTLLRAFIAAGPDQFLPAWGSYESWSDVVRGTVVWLDLPDPAETRESLEAAADPEAAARTALVAGLAEVFEALGHGASAGEILKELISSPNGYQALRSALEESFTRLKSGELPTARSLGRKLRGLQDRIVDGQAIVQLARDSRGIVWGIRRSGDPEPAD